MKPENQATYFTLSALALIGTWTFNIRFIREGKSPLQFITEGFANDALASLSVDIIILAVVLVWWMVREGRRYGIRHTWIYIIFSISIAISVMFPLFLIARNKALMKQTEIHQKSLLTAFYPIASVLGLIVGNFYVIRFLLKEGSIFRFFRAWFSNNAGGSLALDLIFLTLTLFVFGWSQARKRKIRKLPFYMVLCIFGVSFPIPWMFRELDQPHAREAA